MRTRQNDASKTMGLCISLFLLFLLATLGHARPFNRAHTAAFGGHQQSVFETAISLKSHAIITESLRGGATDETDDEDDADVDEYDEYDEEEDDEEEESEDESEDDEEYEDEEEAAVAEVSEGDFVEPYFMSPSMQLYTTFGAMMLSRRVDLFTPLVVRLIRFAFVAQIIIQQLFIVYVRIMAKKNNDRNPVTTQNPLSGMLQSQLEQQDGANGMVKNLASSFLSSETTAMEYDMKQAASMQGGVLFNMAMMWFLHFKMEKVQPLLIQVVTGFMQLAYSPLFQAYILGRNLERPFKTPVSAAQKIMEAQKSAQKDGDEENEEETADKDEDDESDEDEDEVEEDDDNDEGEAVDDDKEDEGEEADDE